MVAGCQKRFCVTFAESNKAVNTLLRLYSGGCFACCLATLLLNDSALRLSRYGNTVICRSRPRPLCFLMWRKRMGGFFNLVEATWFEHATSTSRRVMEMWFLLQMAFYSGFRSMEKSLWRSCVRCFRMLQSRLWSDMWSRRKWNTKTKMYHNCSWYYYIIANNGFYVKIWVAVNKE